jgi:hypothetical protein
MTWDNVEADVADFVRKTITIEYRIASKRRHHERSSHLVRYRQIEKVNQIAAEIRHAAGSKP